MKNKIYSIEDEEFKKIIFNSNTYREIIEKIGYSSNNSNINADINKRCNELNIKIPFEKSNEKGKRYIKNVTKGQLKEDKNTYQRYRSAIRREAEKVFKESGMDYKCVICGYDKHIEIAHIKSVSDFSDSTKISEINDTHNLIALCPNHHWEFDNNKLSDADIEKIESYKNRGVV